MPASQVLTATSASKCRFVVLKCCFGFPCDSTIESDSSIAPKLGDRVIADVGGETEIAIYMQTHIVLPDHTREWIFEIEGVIVAVSQDGTWKKVGRFKNRDEPCSHENL